MRGFQVNLGVSSQNVGQFYRRLDLDEPLLQPVRNSNELFTQLWAMLQLGRLSVEAVSKHLDFIVALSDLQFRVLAGIF